MRDKLKGAAARSKAPSAVTADEPWMTVPQAAKEIGVANATVATIALRGELKTQTVAGRTFIERASVDAYKARQERKQN